MMQAHTGIETKEEVEHNDIERAHSAEVEEGKALEQRVELTEEDVSLL